MCIPSFGPVTLYFFLEKVAFKLAHFFNAERGVAI